MIKRIDLRSDTCTLPTDKMRQVIYSAEVGDQGYGEDKTTLELERYCAELFGKEAALFMTSGTMGDQVALRCWTNSGDEVILDESYHLNYFQSGPSTDLGKILMNTCKTTDGVMTVSDIEALLKGKARGEVFGNAKLVSLENTINGHGGKIYPIETLKSVYEYSKKNGLNVHMDGERFLNACVATGISPSEYAKYSDTITQSFSKGLGAPFGSILMGTKEVIEKAVRYRRWYGGNLHQSGFMAAASLYAIQNHVERLKDDHDNAKLFSKCIKSKFPELKISDPETNIVMIHTKNLGITAIDFVEACKKEDLWMYPYGEYVVRAIVSINVNEEDIVSAADIVDNVLQKIIVAESVSKGA